MRRSPPSSEKCPTAVNPLWGAPRIHGELRKLGIEVAERQRFPADAEAARTAVADLAHVPRQPRPGPGLPRFSTVPTAGLRVLFVFLVLAHHRRRVVLCLLLTPSASSTLNVPAGLIDDGRHAHPHPHRPPPRGPDPARPGAREPRVAAPTGRPPAHRAASTAANRRPAVLGPALPPVGRLDGCRLHRPTRHRHPVAADWLQALLDLEEPPARARPSRCRPGRPRADPTMARANPLWGAPADPRRAPEARPRDLAGHGLQVPGPPSDAPIADLAHVPRQPPSDPRLRGLLRRAHGLFKVLFVFVVLAHERRRVVHINVTDAPTAQWTAQQLVEAFPWETAPRYLLRDRDAVYGVRSRAESSPWGSTKSRRPRGPLGRIRTWNASSAPSAASASTTWWCSTTTHLRRLLRDCRVEGWRGTSCARLQPPPDRTARTVFPYAALLPASCQGL